jgi:glycosyltransferase involved in cell wall biosynthesis
MGAFSKSALRMANRSDDTAKRPWVSVIVPARDEEGCLGACLQSLVTQTGVSFEVIVVDDASTDRTREIALSFPQVCVVDAGPLPEGWTGKNNAMAAGARQARGESLLFTDADTVHQPGSLSRSLAEARQHGAALLSYSPEQAVDGIWEKAVMPVIFAELATTYSPSRVSDPASPSAAANGQYLLISRQAYQAVGGHAAIAGSLLEDVALARKVKASGRRVFFRYGGDAVRTRMYRSFAQLREGWTKNLALLFPSPVWLAVLRLMEFLLIVGSVEAAVLGALYHRKLIAGFALILFFIMCAKFVGRIRKANFPSGATALALLGLPLFAYLLLRSNLHYRRGEITWKGRGYDPRREPRGGQNARSGGVEEDQPAKSILNPPEKLSATSQ